ncbi:hypothetical protein, partial [uncultured Megasphaera sp.]|uniref:hypothetical protein n=1 Tax=uncultured Megasphaera sp. TaxID=165188 RepID=UPI0025999467
SSASHVSFYFCETYCTLSKRLPVLFCEAVILHLDMPFKGKASLCNYVCLNRRMMADEIWE